MKTEVGIFIDIIDNAEEELTIRTDRKSHRTEAVTKDGKLYYYVEAGSRKQESGSRKQESESRKP